MDRAIQQPRSRMESGGRWRNAGKQSRRKETCRGWQHVCRGRSRRRRSGSLRRQDGCQSGRTDREASATNRSGWASVLFDRMSRSSLRVRTTRRSCRTKRWCCPRKIDGDWDDIPKAGINYKTSVNMKMDIRRQKKAIGGYYASVAFMDAQVGKVLDALTPQWTRGSNDRDLHQRPRLPSWRARLLGQGVAAR